MWGGKREGAGRKPLETVRVRVPAGVLDQVNDLIKAYKAGLLKSDPEIKNLKSDLKIKRVKQVESPPVIEVLKAGPKIKNLKSDLKIKRVKQVESPPVIEVLKAGPKIKNLKSDPEIKKAVKDMQGLNTRTVKVLRKAFGTLLKSAELGVRAKPDGGFFVPNDQQYRFEPYC